MYNIFIIHDLSDHSTHPWLLRDQGLLPTTSPRSLTSINKKWVSRIGLAGYPKVVNTQHPLSCLNFLFLSFFLSFSLSFSFFSLYQFIGLCGSPKSAAKSPSSLLLIIPVYRTLQIPQKCSKISEQSSAHWNVAA